MPDQNRPRILIIGLSHLVALKHAQAAREASGNARFDVTWMVLFPFDRYDPLVTAEDGRLVYHPAFCEDLRQIAQHDPPRCVIMSVWSNQHFVHTCARSVPSFDVVLPWAPNCGRIANTEIVPFDLLDRMLRHNFAVDDGLVRTVVPLMPCPVYTLAAPPPVGPVLELPAGSSSQDLDDLVAEYGVADPLLRWKFWSICERAERDAAAAIGVTMLPPPDGTADPDGFRHRDFWGTDWLHGNVAYGERVLRQIDAIIAQAAP